MANDLRRDATHGERAVMKSNAQFAKEAAQDVASRAFNLGVNLNADERYAIEMAIYGALNTASVRIGREDQK